MSADKIKATVVVVGASRGIGLELAKQCHANYPSPGAVVATMRKPDRTLLPKEVNIAALDITQEESVKQFADLFESIDTLIINAAVGGPDKLLETDCALLRHYFESNVIGVHSITQRLIPALLQQTSSNPKRLVYISSTSASMQRQVGAKSGFSGPYSVSKAAGNMLFIQYYNELQKDRVSVGLIHPGWVATDMGKGAGDGGMPVEESVKGIINVIETKLDFESSPLFIDWKGEPVPW